MREQHIRFLVDAVKPENANLAGVFSSSDACLRSPRRPRNTPSRVLKKIKPRGLVDWKRFLIWSVVQAIVATEPIVERESIW